MPVLRVVWVCFGLLLSGLWSYDSYEYVYVNLQAFCFGFVIWHCWVVVWVVLLFARFCCLIGVGWMF